MNESNTSPLLDWLLKKHPETPKGRAKQWILAGRVSVNGVIIRKPHQAIPDPGEALAKLPPSPFARVLIWGSLYLAGEVLKQNE